MHTLFMLLRRSLAILYDSLLLVAVFFIVTALLLIFTNGESIQHPAFYALLWLTAGVFFTSFWRHGGRTLGMTAWQLKLIDDSEAASTLDAVAMAHAKPTHAQLWKRYAAGSLLFGAGLLWAFVDPRSRTASDRLSGTTIIRESGDLKKQA